MSDLISTSIHRRRPMLRGLTVALLVLLSACSGGSGGKDSATDELLQPAAGSAAVDRALEFTGPKDARLSATLSVPESVTRSAAPKAPGVLFVPDVQGGDRDGPLLRVGKPDPLARDFSKSLTAGGIVTLRFDRRGTGASKLEAGTALSFADLVADAKAGLDLLAQRKETEGGKLAVVGYGQGGLVALRLAATDPRVSRVVLVSAPGRPLVEVQAGQLGSTSPAAEALRTTVSAMLANGTLPPLDEQVSEIRPLLPAGDIPFLTELYKLDPTAEAAKLATPVLVVIGSKATAGGRLDSDVLMRTFGSRGELVVADNADESLNEVLKPPLVDPSDVLSPVHDHGAAPPVTTGERDTAAVTRGHRLAHRRVGRHLSRRWWRRFGLRARVTVAFALGAMLLSAGLAGITYELARTYLLRQRETSVLRQTYANARLVKDSLRSADPDIPRLLASVELPAGSDPLLLYRGAWFGASIAVGPGALPLALRQTVLDGRAARQRFGDGIPQLAVGIPLPAVDGTYFEIFAMSELERTLAVLRNSLAAAALATTIAGAIVGRWASRRVLAPVAQVAAAAVAVGASGGRLDVRLDEGGDPDLSSMAVAFNQMTDALQARVRA